MKCWVAEAADAVVGLITNWFFRNQALLLSHSLGRKSKTRLEKAYCCFSSLKTLPLSYQLRFVFWITEWRISSPCISFSFSRCLKNTMRIFLRHLQPVTFKMTEYFVTYNTRNAIALLYLLSDVASFAKQMAAFCLTSLLSSSFVACFSRISTTPLSLAKCSLTPSAKRKDC